MSGEETRTRFLAAIASQLPAARVIEVHLFGAIRQGGMESGVAVIAVDPDEPVAISDPAAPMDAAAHEAVTPNEPNAHDGSAALAESDVESDVEAEAETQSGPGADETIDADAHLSHEDAPLAAASPATSVAPPKRRAAPRYTVFTARYRHTLKGPERGKWDASVTEEADAPLITVDAVVRGVSRRSGDADETVRLSGDEFRAALPAVLPALPSSARPARV